MKVVFCTPTRVKPHDAYLAAMEASVPLLDAHGIEHSIAFEVGCPYISSAMATLSRKALDKSPDALIYLDDDVSWDPLSLLALIESPEDVIGGTYRFKKEPVEYMGMLATGPDSKPIGEFGKKLLAKWLPSGFLKISANAINEFMKAYPELICGPRYHPTIDLFNHGAHEGIWYGQDYAFCRNYAAKCGKVWLLPNLNIDHNDWNSDRVYPGNFHEFLRSQPGGDLSQSPRPANVSPLHGHAQQLRTLMAQ